MLRRLTMRRLSLVSMSGAGGTPSFYRAASTSSDHSRRPDTRRRSSGLHRRRDASLPDAKCLGGAAGAKFWTPPKASLKAVGFTAAALWVLKPISLDPEPQVVCIASALFDRLVVTSLARFAESIIGHPQHYPLLSSAAPHSASSRLADEQTGPSKSCGAHATAHAGISL